MIITSTAASGRRDDLFEFYQRHLAPRAEANEGQEVVIWCADQQNPDVFVLFELYRDGEVMAANAGADWFDAYMAEAMPLLAAQPQIVMAEPRWSTGL